MGSKARLVKDILPIILRDRVDGQCFVDLFAGGMNVVCEVSGNRIANDKNYHLIEMWRGLVNGVKYPIDISRNLYNFARDVYNNRETGFEYQINMTDDLIGWIGFMGSANGRFFDGGYSGKSITKNGSIRDYISESIRNIEPQIDKMKEVELVFGGYGDVKIPSNSILYIDPPYKGTKAYSTSKDFNYEEMFDWLRLQKRNGHTVFLSEYNAPSDFICVWQKEFKSSLSANGLVGGNKNSLEKLFTI